MGLHPFPGAGGGTLRATAWAAAELDPANPQRRPGTGAELLATFRAMEERQTRLTRMLASFGNRSVILRATMGRKLEADSRSVPGSSGSGVRQKTTRSSEFW
jgi:hypothetical protein